MSMTDLRPIGRPRVGFVADLRRHSGRTALVADGVRVSYDELADRIEPGEWRERRLAVCTLESTVDSVVDYLATLAAGDAVLVVPPGDAGRSVAAPYPTGDQEPDLHPDLALALSTSGSTGSPKLVRLSHGNVDANARQIATSLGLGPDDVGITSLPLHYTYGLSVLHSHLAVGAAVVLTDLSVVDPCFWGLVDAHGVTGVAGVPFTFDLLDRTGVANRSHPSLRRITQAGGRLDADSVVRWASVGRRQGWELVVMYGQTEATARITVLPPDEVLDHPTSVGRAVPGMSLRLADADHPDPDVGELVVAGPNVMMGYAQCAADLARGHDVDELHTGDLARITPDGLVEIVGRLSRMIKPFGVRLDLARLEDELRSAVGPVTVVGDDDGLVVCVPPGTRTDAVRETCMELAGVPRRAVQVVAQDVPHLASGKVDAAALLAAGRRRGTTDRHAADVRLVFADVLGCRDIASTDTFVSLGGDSLSYVEVSIRLETILGSVPDGWHVMSVVELERIADDRPDTSHGPLVQMDTTVALRAAAIGLVVAYHTDLLPARGGAHVLLVLAGYNLARFQLDRPSWSARGMWRSVAAIAIPSVAWLMLQSLFWDHDWKNFLLLHNYIGSLPLGPAWRYWYIEVLVQAMVVLTLLLSVGRIRRFERDHQYAAALGVVALTLGASSLVDVPTGFYVRFTTHTVIWMFALGWLVYRSTTRRRRVGATVLTLLAVPGFFGGDWTRDAVVITGVAVLVWVPRVRVPRHAVRPIGEVAAASLAIYLTHWQVYHPLRPEVPAWIVAPLCLAVGVAVWRCAMSVLRWLRGRRSQSRPAYIASISAA